MIGPGPFPADRGQFFWKACRPKHFYRRRYKIENHVFPIKDLDRYDIELCYDAKLEGAGEVVDANDRNRPPAEHALIETVPIDA